MTYPIYPIDSDKLYGSMSARPEFLSLMIQQSLRQQSTMCVRKQPRLIRVIIPTLPLSLHYTISLEYSRTH